MRPKLIYLVSLLLLSACGWDDDSAYAIRTRSSFLLGYAPNASTPQVLRIADGAVTYDWSATVNVPSAALGGVDMRDNLVFLGNVDGRTLFVIDPQTGQAETRYDQLPVRPHHIAVGRDRILLADTTDGSLAFIHRRRGTYDIPPFEAKPGPAIYNNGRFYLVTADSAVTIYDEKAMTPRVTLTVGKRITDIQFDRYMSVVIQARDSGGSYQSWIASNGDYLFRENLPVTFEKRRMTDWYTRRYGREYLEDLIVDENVLTTTQLVHVLDSVENFEVDFFEGTLFYAWKDTLYRYDLNAGEMIDTLPYAFEMVRAFHQYGGE